jgi:membrane associated rhomboid family serine protease
MNTTGIISLLLIAGNIIFSYKGFTNPVFFHAYSFDVEKVLVYKQYKRLVTSGFLHVSWLHLLFNMFALYSFSGILEAYLGGLPFLIIYMAGLIGGNLFALYVNRNHGDYSAVGASGAVCGIIFSSIALFPGMSVGFFGLPLSIPSWLYGLVFIGFTIYGIRSGIGNTGHEAHMGGALVGMGVAILMEPSSLLNNYLPILAITVPSVIFIYFLVARPGSLTLPHRDRKRQAKILSIDQRYNLSEKEKQREIDIILEKIHRKGPDSLTKTEKDKLDAYSRSK